MESKHKTKLIYIIILLVLLVFLFLSLMKITEKRKQYENEGLGHLCLDDCSGYSGIVDGIKDNAFQFNNSYFIVLNQSNLDIIGSDSFKIDMWFKNDKDTIADLIFKGSSNKSWFSWTQRNNRYGNDIWLQFDAGGDNSTYIRSNYSLFPYWHHSMIEANRLE